MVRAHKIAKELEPWGILIAVVALLFTVVSFWLDFGDRIEERKVRAWQLLSTTTAGITAKVEALEYLNGEDGVFCFEWLEGRLNWLHSEHPGAGCIILWKPKAVLYGVDLSRKELKNLDDCLLRKAGVFLQNVNLRRGLLKGADFSSSSLFKADFRIADLMGANFSCAYLMHAQLQDAILINANLTYSILHDADLTGARLTDADLSSADLGKTLGLKQAQLMNACGNPETILPNGLSVPLCLKPKGVFGR